MTDPEAGPADTAEPIGLVDGSSEASTNRWVVLEAHAVVQLDDLLVCHQTLPDGSEVAHYGIVVEAGRSIEGATFSSDTARIARDLTMPGITSRRVEVQVLRTVPELWLAPDPGTAVYRAAGAERDRALFIDEMAQPLAVGVDQRGEAVHLDFSFLSGERGGHVNISGISGVATKTTYAMFLLYQLLETEVGRRLLGASAPNTRALVFNVKGEDLLHLDKPNAKLEADGTSRERWRTLGVDDPGAFESVRLYAPRLPGSADGTVQPDIRSRSASEVVTYGWTAHEFIRRGLLRFCFTEADDTRTQVGFVEQRVRIQLARHAHPMVGRPDCVVMADAPATNSQDFEVAATAKRDELEQGDGFPVRSFRELVEFIATKVDPDLGDQAWQAGAATGTLYAFLRRLWAQVPRLGHLVAEGVETVDIDANAAVHVVDIHTLHTQAQRFVVGALLEDVFSAKQGRGRQPLRFVVLDELNKYAPRDSSSPIKDLLVDIAERGRSLGVLLIGAQQAASSVDAAIIRNASIKVVGRLDSAEAADYRFLSTELRERATRFMPGTMVLDQPVIPAPIPLRFPFPGFATNPDEAAVTSTEQADAAAVFDKLSN